MFVGNLSEDHATQISGLLPSCLCVTNSAESLRAGNATFPPDAVLGLQGVRCLDSCRWSPSWQAQIDLRLA